MKSLIKSLLKSVGIYAYVRKYSSSYRKFGRPREFSNQELKKFAHLFIGDIVNVSGWNDSDKQNSTYRQYFKKANKYMISNFEKDQKGYQGFENEFYLDLENPLPKNLNNKFDVVFCHTVLEHVFDMQQAFENLSKMSKDILIIVVPFMQQLHGSGYKDYWRFTPESLKKMYLKYGFTPRYISANAKDKASIYIFSIGYRDNKWDSFIPKKFEDRINPNLELGAEKYSNALGSRLT